PDHRRTSPAAARDQGTPMTRSPTPDAVRCTPTPAECGRAPSCGPTYTDTAARVDLCPPHEPLDCEVLTELRIGKPARRAVVDRRDAVPRQDRRVREPPRDVAPSRRAEHVYMRRLERSHEGMLGVDLRPRGCHVDLGLDAV